MVGLRLALMALTMLAVVTPLATWGFGPAAQGLAALILGSVVLPYGDLRPDNFSLLFFALTARPLQRPKPGKGALAAVFLLFALWSNLHLGWAFGLALLAIGALGHFLDGRRAEARGALALLAVACAGTLLNPYGWGLWSVLLDHARRLHGMTLEIQEWAPPDFRDPFRWPLAALLAACAAGLLARFHARRGPSWTLVLGLLFFGGAALRHDRHLTFFAVFAVPALFALARDAGAGASRALRTAGAVAFVALAAAMGRFAWSAPTVEEPSRELADFLESHAERLSDLPLYNTWEDGGYLGWRLFPRYRVYFDGRYLFHAQLDEVREAALSASSWRAFLERRGVALACMKRSALKSFVQDGSRRPYYAAYMPPSEWALVHWDARRLVFARRSSVEPRWVRAHEFALLRPDDEGFDLAAAARGRPSAAAVDAELSRLRADSPSAVPEAEALARVLKEPTR